MRSTPTAPDRASLLKSAASALVIATAALSTASAHAQSRADPEPPSAITPKRTVFADTHMIVAAHPLAAEAGLAVLRAGGSAADAGIAAQLVLNVVEPQSSGLGGGGFALYWRAATGKLTAWDGRETAPLAAGPDYFWVPAPPEPTESVEGVAIAPEVADPDAPAPMRKLGWREAVASGRSIGAPGLARLLEAMHERYGLADWEDLFEPAIRLAETGFPISERLETSIAGAAERLATDPAAAELFLNPDGTPRAAGDILVQPNLAETLRELADDGAEALHEDDIAEAIVAAVGRPPVPGALTLDDLEAYRALERRPVCAPYRGRFEVCGMGPPSSGAVGVGQILGLLDPFPIPALGPDNPSTAHLFLEASRLAYADRAQYLADPDHVSVPAAGLLDPTYLLLRAQIINRARAALGRARAGNPPWREATLYAPDLTDTEAGTTHISVVDGNGDVFVLTSSVETSFGSARMAAGMILNNQLTDFSFDGTVSGLPVANAVGPRKRPRSSMAPTIVFDLSSGQRRPVLALGSPGGSRIIEYVAAAISAVLDHQLPPGEAAARPHLSHRNRAQVAVEARGDADATADALIGFGHRVERRAMTSGLHMIGIGADGALAGGADPRREGVALGD